MLAEMNRTSIDDFTNVKAVSKKMGEGADAKSYATTSLGHSKEFDDVYEFLCDPNLPPGPGSNPARDNAGKSAAQFQLP